MMPFAHPAVQAAQARAYGMDIETLNQSALAGYEMATAQSSVNWLVVEQSQLSFGTVEGIDFATIPHAMQLTGDNFPNLPASCNTLAIWSDNGQTYAHVFGYPRTDVRVKQVVPQTRVMIASAKPCSTPLS